MVYKYLILKEVHELSNEDITCRYEVYAPFDGNHSQLEEIKVFKLIDGIFHYIDSVKLPENKRSSGFQTSVGDTQPVMNSIGHAAQYCRQNFEGQL